MSKRLVIFGSSLAVIVPIFAYIRNVSWGEFPPLISIFPVFGLLAFTLLWLHAVSGVFEEWLRINFDFDRFIRWSASIIFVSIILHPLLLLTLAKFELFLIFGPGEHQRAMLLGLAGLILLLTYDIGKAFKRYDFFVRNWNKILIISNIGFILTFFHSLQVGSSLQTGFMRGLWIFYGVTAMLAIIYTYGIKRRLM